ncbi:cytochrome P450 family protein [Nocardia sp. CA-107356]|uniref:cytochrome P450 family protein n=1 Tax=Nocardia sp. CA-107356 TaxID=3239972 RepID=UPI003D91CB45
MVHENASAASELAAEMVELADDFYHDPHAVYDRLRSRGPVHHVRLPDSTTGWLITDYEVAKAAFTDPAISKALKSSGGRAALASHGGDQHVQSGMFKDMMVFCDPPEHTRLRALVNRAFGSRAVRELEPRITEIADSLLASMAVKAGDVHDLLDDYANPLGMMVICELLGVPHQDRDSFRGWSTILLSSEQTNEARTTAVQKFIGYIDQLIHSKGAAPGHDLLSALLTEGEQGDRLTHRELISMVFLLLVAGFETTVNLIGNAVSILLADNDLRRQLLDDPGRITPFVEEVLRYESPATEATFRYTAASTILGGVEIPAGQLILVSMCAADRDPHRFPDPHRFDINRPNSHHHLAFGGGIHRCVGAPLARSEAVIALSRLLGEYPEFHLADSPDLQWRKSLIVRGLVNLSVQLRP